MSFAELQEEVSFLSSEKLQTLRAEIDARLAANVTWKPVPFASILPDTDGNGLGAIDDHTAVVYDADQASASSNGLVTLSADGSVIHHTAAIQSPTFVGFTTPQIGFAIDTRLWRTTDGGATWAVVPVGS